MLPSDMNLNIRSGTVRYNNKILISDEKFSLGKNEKVNSLETAPMKHTQIAATCRDSHYKLVHAPIITHKNLEPQTMTHISHNDEKIALVLFPASGFAI